ncbi:MAG TPA: hypothetical protein VGL39_07600 [Jatrophihabitantaceae bacterium]
MTPAGAGQEDGYVLGYPDGCEHGFTVDGQPTFVDHSAEHDVDAHDDGGENYVPSWRGRAYREMLAAVLDAIDLPHPATIGDGEIHDQVLKQRAMHAVISARTVLERPDGTSWDVAYLRERLAEHPTDSYAHWPPVYPTGAS